MPPATGCYAPLFHPIFQERHPTLHNCAEQLREIDLPNRLVSSCLHSMLSAIHSLGKRLSLRSDPTPKSSGQQGASAGANPDFPRRSHRSPRSLALRPAEAASGDLWLHTPSPPSSPLGAAPDLSGMDLLLCLPTPFCLVDRQGRELASNPAFRTVLGDRTGFLALLPPQEQARAMVFMAVGAPGCGSLVSHSQLGGPQGRRAEWTVVAAPRPGLFVVTARCDSSTYTRTQLTPPPIAETLRGIPPVSLSRMSNSSGLTCASAPRAITAAPRRKWKTAPSRKRPTMQCEASTTSFAVL